MVGQAAILQNLNEFRLVGIPYFKTCAYVILQPDFSASPLCFLSKTRIGASVEMTKKWIRSFRRNDKENPVMNCGAKYVGDHMGSPLRFVRIKNLWVVPAVDFFLDSVPVPASGVREVHIGA
jgi:hypothetical protein